MRLLKISICCAVNLVMQISFIGGGVPDTGRELSFAQEAACLKRYGIVLNESIKRKLIPTNYV